MAALSKQQIYDQIIAHINKEGGSYSSWYVGIASDPKQRLFNDHQVPKENAWFIYREAYTAEDARVVEKYILDNHHTDGGGGGGDSTTKFVYAYKKTVHTNP